MSDAIRQRLCELVVRYGVDVVRDARRCEALIRDFCGNATRECNLLLVGLREGISTDLLEISPGGTVATGRLIRRLVDNVGLAEPHAKWSVECWVVALGRRVGPPPLPPPTFPPVTLQPATQHNWPQAKVEGAGSSLHGNYEDEDLGNEEDKMPDWDGCGPCGKCRTVINMVFAHAVCPICGHHMTWQQAFEICGRYPGSLPRDVYSERDL
jgi:hypothetical protein